MIRVFVVDDSAFARRAITRVLGADPGIKVVGEAANGAEALTRVPTARPDVITLDLAMPGMDGLTALRALVARDPGVRVLMLSVHTQEGAEATLEALAAGAVDFVDKSRFGLMEFDGLGRELRERIKALTTGRGNGQGALADGVGSRSRTGDRPGSMAGRQPIDLCVLGASTGGPAAIQHVLETLPATFPVPLAIVQHMPPGFTGPFARRLDQRCRLRVREAEDGDRLERGTVLIAPAGYHMRVNTSLAVTLSADSGHARHVPSVDVLMQSAARARPGRVLGVLLTGMGDDGADGMAVIHGQGGITLTESETTCVVYGMPRVAWERGVVTRQLPLPALAEWLAGLTAASPAESPARP